MLNKQIQSSLLLLVIILISSELQQVRSYEYYLTVGSECSSILCNRSTWSYENKGYSFVCPQSGKFIAVFENEGENNISLDLTAYNMFSDDTIVHFPLIKGNNTSVDGVWQYAQLNNNEQFVLLDCAQSISKQITPLCLITSHLYVGTRKINNDYNNNCAFSLDFPLF